MKAIKMNDDMQSRIILDYVLEYWKDEEGKAIKYIIVDPENERLCEYENLETLEKDMERLDVAFGISEFSF